MLFGYSSRTIDENGLLEMREVSVAANANTLRQIASFFNEMAEIMDKGGFVKCSHKHISSVVKDWTQRHPNSDIIVMPSVEQAS
jgi:hypothetical protein